MKKWLLFTVALLITALATGPALAQELYVFPAQGQSEEQMEKDKYECYQWAKKETGFDPMEVPKATEPPPEKSAGGLIGRRSRARQDAKKQEQWKQEQAANYQNNRNAYNRAYGACLEGKGYTVK